MAQLKGKLLHKTATGSKISAKGTQYQERVIYVNPYVFDRETGAMTVDAENVVKFKLFGDTCALVENIAVGTDVTVTYTLRGRKVTAPTGQTDVYNDINVRTVTAPGQFTPTPTPAPQPRPEIHREPQAVYTPQPQQPTPKNDDLPF